MPPLIGIVVVTLFGLLSAGAAGKLYFHRWFKKMRKRKPSPSPSTELKEDLEMGSVELSTEKNVEKSVADAEEEEEDVVAALMKVHNLSGPPRFLFTIEEEKSEDLASEDGKKSAKKSSKLIDLMHAADREFLTPIASPVNKSTRALTGSRFDGDGLVNVLFDFSAAEKNEKRVRRSSSSKL